jgi:pyruvate dehydrogenase E1 component alpha subunit/2-oxoisovalerate dehydrogenase E1 component alpha subunit
VLVCQNNHWSISVPTARQTAARTLAAKGRAYGMPSVRVDGNDLLALHQVLGDAAARARRGEGPTFIEAVTYRIGAHSTSDDPTRYRSDAEVEAWKQKDPVDRLAKHLRQRGLLGDAFEAQLEEEILAEIGEAVRDVELLPAPERASLFDDVYAAVPAHLRAQREALLALPPAPRHG